MHYYKRNLGDYAKKAGRLSMLQHGSYTLLIDACYDREQFPTLEEAIDWTWASTNEEIEAVKFVLSKFFDLENGVYIQKRIQEEIEEYHGKSEKNKKIAIERETKRKEKDTKRARIVNEAPPNQEPITNNQEPQTNTTPPSAAASVCLALSKLGYSDINPANPKLLKLLEAGVTVEEFEGAAKTSSVRKFSYVLGIVQGQREQAAKIEPEKLRKAEKPWYITSSGIEDKGREIGLVHDPSEAFPYFKARVFKAHGITEDMLRKANIDWGSG